MRYPVNNFKTEWNLSAGNPFGIATSYGFHEGVDINDNGAGNSDLGKEIFAIQNGELQYWHGAKHPDKDFGYHSVYKITGSYGTRWIHQAHCMPDITPAPKAVSENERIARVGNSGTTLAHIHFAVFKVDPATLPNGIDTLAKTQQQLSDWWEDPIKFIESQIQPIPDLQQQLDQMRLERDRNWNLYQAEVTKNKDLTTKITTLTTNLTTANDKIAKFKELAQKIING